MSDKHAKKAAKLALLLKNRRIQTINMNEDEHARGRDLEKERDEEIKASSLASGRASALKHKQEGEPAWSARMQQIRDKNTGRARMATERWNRFSGTESGGGRGL